MKHAFFLALLFTAPLRAEIVDRIVAVVDGRVITWSAVLAEANYQALQNGREPVATLDAAALGTITTRMADQMLLEREKDSSAFSPPESGDRESGMEDLRKRFATSAEFQQQLGRYHLTESDLLQRLSQEAGILAFIEYHLRPQVHLTPGAVENYYKDTLLPQLRQQGHINAPPLEQVSGEIEQVLTEKEINRLLEEWLRQLRSRARIRLSQPRP